MRVVLGRRFVGLACVLRAAILFVQRKAAIVAVKRGFLVFKLTAGANDIISGLFRAVSVFVCVFKAKAIAVPVLKKAVTAFFIALTVVRRSALGTNYHVIAVFKRLFAYRALIITKLHIILRILLYPLIITNLSG